MTQLRDARLHKALDAAPDAGVQPHRRTRDAIRAAAHGAVQPAWRRWWTRAGTHPMPWIAALATLVLATLVAVTWQGQEPPGARPETTAAVEPAPAPVPLPAPTTAPEPAAAPAPETAVAPQAGPAPSAAVAPAQGPVPSATPAPPVAAAPATPLPDRAAPEALAKAAPAREESRARAAPQPPAAVAEAPPAPAAPLSPAPAGTPAPPAAVAPAAPQPAPAAPALDRQGTASVRSLAAGLPWTQVRIEANGRSVVVPRPQAGQLPALVTSMLASTSDEAAPGGARTLRLELAQGDEALGVLDLVGDGWRWTPMRDAGPSRLLRADPAVASSLREEAQRLLER